MKPYSKDLRLRVLSAVDAGMLREEVAKTFSVSMPTIKRWLRRRRERPGMSSQELSPAGLPGRALCSKSGCHITLRPMTTSL
jgi:transposase